jgi:hypothetical protein
MSAFDLLLVGLALGALGYMVFFWALWRREVVRHAQTRASRDMLRLRLALMARSDLGDALVAVTPARPRLSDEQQMVTAIREADHYEMQRLK